MREKTNENQILPGRTLNEARPVGHKHMPSLCVDKGKGQPQVLQDSWWVIDVGG